MPLAPLAVEADLLARNIHISDEVDVATLLASASAAIRDAAGSSITRTTVNLSLHGTRDPWLPIPVQPIRSVVSVTVDGSEVEDFTLVDGRLWRTRGWQGSRWPTVVSAQVEFGYDDPPDDIIDLCCSLVAAAAAATEDGYDPGRGLTGLSIDDYRESYARGDEEVVNPLDLPERTRALLRERFGSGGAYVTGSY